jgi:hypothetical protein
MLFSCVVSVGGCAPSILKACISGRSNLHLIGGLLQMLGAVFRNLHPHLQGTEFLQSRELKALKVAEKTLPVHVAVVSFVQMLTNCLLNDKRTGPDKLVRAG